MCSLHVWCARFDTDLCLEHNKASPTESSVMSQIRHGQRRESPRHCSAYDMSKNTMELSLVRFLNMDRLERADIEG